MSFRARAVALPALLVAAAVPFAAVVTASLPASAVPPPAPPPMPIPFPMIPSASASWNHGGNGGNGAPPPPPPPSAYASSSASAWPTATSSSWGSAPAASSSVAPRAPRCVGSAHPAVNPPYYPLGFAPVASAPTGRPWAPAPSASALYPRPSPSACASVHHHAPPSASASAHVPSYESPTYVRIVDAASTVGPIDVCFAPHRDRCDGGVDFASMRPAIGGRGLVAGDVSTYLTMPAGAYALRVVVAGSKDCATPITEKDPVELVDPRGGFATYTLVHPSGAPARWLALREQEDDDPEAPGPMLAVRSLVESSGVAVGTGSLAGGDFEPIGSSPHGHCMVERARPRVTLSAHRPGAPRDGVIVPDALFSGDSSLFLFESEAAPGSLFATFCAEDRATARDHRNPTCRRVGPR